MSTQPEQLPTGEAFGFPPNRPGDFGRDDPLMDGIDIEEPEEGTEEPVEPEAPTEPAAPAYAPRHAAPEAQEGEEPEGEEQVEPLQFAGREFPSVEEAERSYQEMQSWATRVINDAREQNTAYGELQAQVAQQQQTLEAIMPFLSQQMLAENPELAEQLQRQAEIERLVTERVQQQVGPIQEQTAAAAEEAQRRQAYDSNVDNFYRSHPEVEEGSELDRAVGAAFVELRRSTGLNMANPQALDVALEVAQNPRLLQVYKLNPTYLDTEEGRSFAKSMAATPEIQAAIDKGQAKRQGRGEAQRRAAFTEHGGSGIPAGTPGKAPKGDEFDEALELWKSERETSIFNE